MHNPSSTAEPHHDPEFLPHFWHPHVPKHSPTMEASSGWAQHQRPEDVHYTCCWVVRHGFCLFHRLKKKAGSKCYMLFPIMIVMKLLTLSGFLLCAIYLAKHLTFHFLFHPCETLTSDLLLFILEKLTWEFTEIAQSYPVSMWWSLNLNPYWAIKPIFLITGLFCLQKELRMCNRAIREASPKTWLLKDKQEFKNLFLLTNQQSSSVLQGYEVHFILI